MPEHFDHQEETNPWECAGSSIITRAEERILASLDHSTIERARALYTENLVRSKSLIVGVRSEDILFFLSALQQGFLPTEGNFLRSKKGAEGYFYLTFNPEFVETDAQERIPAALRDGIHMDFQEAAMRNAQTYDDIAIRHAIVRNFPIHLQVRGDGALQKEMRRVLQDVGREITDSVYIDEYLALLVEEIRRLEISSSPFDSPRRFPALNVLGRELDRQGFSSSKNGAFRFLHTLPRRGGVMVAFGQALLEQYSLYRGGSALRSEGELVIAAQGQEISTDTILGFESLGDFEDEILARLGVA